MILRDITLPKAMVICERLEDGSRFTEYTSTSVEAVRLLRSTSPAYYRPLYLIRIKPHDTSRHRFGVLRRHVVPPALAKIPAHTVAAAA